MLPHTSSILEIIYKNWRTYPEKLRDCITSPYPGATHIATCPAHVAVRATGTAHHGGQGGVVQRHLLSIVSGTWI
jgi:hypothetical protein